MALNTSTSIVDFLKSQNKLSDFASRKRLYESIGLNNNLGDYRGSDVQNIEFLKNLQTVPQQPDITPTPLTTEKIAQEQQAGLAVPQQFRDLVPPTPKIEPTAEDILSRVRQTPSVQFGEKAAELAKQGVQTAAEQARGGALESLSERGLIRSPGMVSSATEPINAERIAKELNIDLSLAKIVASAIEEDRSSKLKAETEKANQYSAYLKSQGLVLNPLTGQIEPDKAFQRAEKSAELAENRDARAEQASQLAQEKFDILIKQAAGSGELTTKQLTSAIQIGGSLKSHPAYTDMIDVQTGMNGVKSGLSQKIGFGDIVAINAFQRMIDPGATVRAEDIVTLQKGSAFINKVLELYPIEKLRTGAMLPQETRDEMMKTAKDLYEIHARGYNSTVGEQYKNLARGAGVDFSYIGADFPVTAKETGGGDMTDFSKMSDEELTAFIQANE